MARDVEELFGEGDDRPQARTGPAIGLAVGGVVVAILGMACLAAPGGVLVLLGLWSIDRELDRVENGYLSDDQRAPVQRARNFVLFCLALVILLFVAQLFLYCNGFYQGLGDTFFAVLHTMSSAVGG